MDKISGACACVLSSVTAQQSSGYKFMELQTKSKEYGMIPFNCNESFYPTNIFFFKDFQFLLLN